MDTTWDLCNRGSGMESVGTKINNIVPAFLPAILADGPKLSTLPSCTSSECLYFLRFRALFGGHEQCAQNRYSTAPCIPFQITIKASYWCYIFFYQSWTFKNANMLLRDSEMMEFCNLDTERPSGSWDSGFHDGRLCPRSRHIRLAQTRGRANISGWQPRSPSSGAGGQLAIHPGRELCFLTRCRRGSDDRGRLLIFMQNLDWLVLSNMVSIFFLTTYVNGQNHRYFFVDLFFKFHRSSAWNLVLLCLRKASAGPLLRFRRSINAQNIAVLADVKKKHSAHALTSDIDIVETVKAADFFQADGVIVTGASTGHPADSLDLRKIKAATGDRCGHPFKSFLAPISQEKKQAKNPFGCSCKMNYNDLLEDWPDLGTETGFRSL